MYRKISEFAKHSVIYGFGSLATRLVGFLLIPVYTRLMTPADYGILALCGATVGALSIVSMAGIPSALFRSYLHVARSEEDRGTVQTTALMTLLAIGTGALAFLLIFRRQISFWLLGDPELHGFITLLAVTNFAQSFLQFRNTMFRIHDESVRYSVITLITYVVNLSASLYLVVGLRWGAWGAMVANTLAPTFIALLFVPWCLRHLRGGFSPEALKGLLTYGLPLIPAGLAVWVMNLSDIYMLRIFREPSEVGLYNLGYRFGLGILLVINAIKFAYPKVVFSEGETSESVRLFNRVPTYYSVAVGYLCFGMSIFAPEIILIADARFRSVWPVIPLVVFAYFFNGLIPMFEVGINLRNKTYLLVGIFIGGGLLNIVLNLIFVPRYGMMAAATTTLVTYLLLPVPTYLLTTRLYPLRVEWHRLAHLALILVVAAVAAVMPPVDSRWQSVAIKLAAFLAVPPALWFTGFFTTEERLKVARWLGRPART